MDQTKTTFSHHQNFMLAVRRLMGWPGFRPANDCLCFASGRAVDFETGTELARISQQSRKDVIYTSWANTRARRPSGFTIVCRELLTVDVVTRVVPWCATAEEPLVFLSIRDDEFFALDRRGTLVRLPGRPAGIARGRQLAMKRIAATAATMSDDLLTGNHFVRTGADWVEPEVPVETVVRFA